MQRKIIPIDLILIIFFLFSLLLVIFEYLSHTNFVSNIFRVNYAHVFIISVSLLLIRLVIVSKLNVLKFWKKIVFVLPIVLTAFMLIIFMKRFNLYLRIEAEDSLIESLQILLLFLSSAISFYLAKFFWKSKKFLASIFIVLGVGFFLVGGEEISWGQRIFDIKTPEEYAKLNTQGEITIHNYGPIFEYVYKGYALIGFIGAFAWIVKNWLVKKVKKPISKVFKVLIPEWQYFFYFFLTFAYNFEVHILHPRTGVHTGNALWEEPTELLLFFGLTLFLLEIVVKRKHHAK